jgi:hypothetical protein
MYKITQSIHLANIEKYISVTRENPGLFHTDRINPGGG